MKKTIITIVIIIALIAVYFIGRGSSKPEPVVTEETPSTITTPVTPATTTTPVTQTDKTKTIIGTSVEGRDIVAYHYGTGSKEILFVGGIHGGYGWNTALLAYQVNDYLKANPTSIPSGLRVTVIPVLNPDGLNMVVGTTTGNFTAKDVVSAKLTDGRFNAANVDLNRNFDCDWKAKAVWQNKPVSGGDAAFSEPESQAVKSYVDKNLPTAVVVWYSAAGGVYASNCHDGVLPGTETLMKTFATASGYPAFKSYDYYATTGDMSNWLAKDRIPAISVLLTDHTNTEYTKNLAGVKALIEYYSK
jgi:hypothetical protein